MSHTNRPLLSPENDCETKRRSREIQILVNVLEPDPQNQPYFLSDEATVFEVSAESEETIKHRLEFHFGEPLKISLQQPLWKLVDKVKENFPGWPDAWPPRLT
jgi:hypothetical protein